jgi:hypothetical protein
MSGSTPQKINFVAMSNITGAANVDGDPTPPPVGVKPPEKLRTIMDAASALTSLGDEEEEEAPAEEAAVVLKEEPASNHETEEISSSGEPKAAEPSASPAPKVEDEDGAEDARPPSPKVVSSESSNNNNNSGGPPPKRYLPEHKKPDAAPTFPEKVCLRPSRHVCVLKSSGTGR